MGRQFPSLRNAPVRALAAGWDNTVLMVGDVLFRFPRREAALDGLRRELAVLPLVAPRVPLPVPVPTHLGAPAGDYPWPFWGAAPLAGRELAGLPEAARLPAAEATGGFLRVLHQLPVADDLDLPTDPMGRATPELRAERSQGALRDLAARGLWQRSAEVESLVEARLGPPTGTPVLVQGDLHLRHLLVDEDGRATGVIDWGDTCLADPALDLSLAYAGFTGGAREALLAAYGPVDSDRELRARALAAGLCAMLAVWAAEVGETELLSEYLRGIARAAS